MDQGTLDHTVREVTDRELEPKPLLRGVSHLVFGGIAVFAWMTLVVLAPSVGERTALAVYMVGMCCMLFFSSLMHRGNWSPSTAHTLLKLDLTGIYLAISGTYTALVGIGITGWARPAILITVWTGAAIGAAAVWLPIKVHPAFGHVLYLILGWVAVLAMPVIWSQLGAAVFFLVLAGGVCYTAGAVAHITHRPDPVPEVFGFHEVFHACTIAGAICHYVAVAVIVFGS
ncbi:MAG: PAQR family membrane homeostasis protein TrhA [Acidimicrobiia bacterium]